MSEYLSGGTLLGGRYEILEKVGSGGMAIVYKAKCRLLQRYVAIKVLRPEFREDAEFIKRFDIEAKAAASLSHPNIVSIYDIGRDGELHYIVMEHVEGITLKQYIAERGRLPWREAANIEAQICSALECAHKNHIIHHDIKPHNIILTNENIIKVADFGIARAATTSTLVAGSSAIGSVHYFSPEQARGGYTDEKSDIYSAGIVFYEMLTGRVPFDGDSPIAVALMHTQNAAMPPRAINPDIPGDVEHIVMRAISKEQRARYQSAADMLADVNAVRSSRGLVSEQDGSTIKLDPVQAKGKAELGRGRVERKEHRKHEKPPKTKGEKIAMWLGISFAAAIVIAGAVMMLNLAGVFNWGSGEYEVPVVTDMDIEAARKVVKDADVTIEIKEEEASDKPKDYVLSQDPKSGRRVKTPTVIYVVVSSGEELVEVPSLVNLEERGAIIELENRGLKAFIIDENSETIPEGVVLGQSPDAGAKVKKGTQVNVRVSSQTNKTVTTPNLSGKTLAQAKLAIENADLTVGTVSEEFSSKTVGTVIEQNPLGGVKLTRRSVVNIVVSKGPEATASSTPTPTSTATPTPTPDNTVRTQSLIIGVPQDRATCTIKVTANDSVIYNASHKKADGEVTVPVTGSGTVTVKIYIDGELRETKTMNF